MAAPTPSLQVCATFVARRSELLGDVGRAIIGLDISTVRHTPCEHGVGIDDDTTDAFGPDAEPGELVGRVKHEFGERLGIVREELDRARVSFRGEPGDDDELCVLRVFGQHDIPLSTGDRTPVVAEPRPREEVPGARGGEAA